MMFSSESAIKNKILSVLHFSKKAPKDSTFPNPNGNNNWLEFDLVPMIERI